MRTKRLTSLSARLDALEAKTADTDDQIFVSFIDGTHVIRGSGVELTIPDNLRGGTVWHNGEQMTREEAERRYQLDSKPHRTIRIPPAKDD